MASLARSLLALAVLALLQAACALSPDTIPSEVQSFSCNTYLFGKRTYNPDRTYELPRIYLRKVDNRVVLPDPKDIGLELIGEEVQACGRNFTVGPEVKLSVPSSYKYLEVVAKTECLHPPIYIELRVTRYYRLPGRPSNESD